MFSGLFIHLTLLFGFASCPVWFASFLCWRNTFRITLFEILLHPMFMEVVLGSQEHCSQVFWGFTFSVWQVNECCRFMSAIDLGLSNIDDISSGRWVRCFQSLFQQKGHYSRGFFKIEILQFQFHPGCVSRPKMTLQPYPLTSKAVFSLDITPG